METGQSLRCWQAQAYTSKPDNPPQWSNDGWLHNVYKREQLWLKTVLQWSKDSRLHNGHRGNNYDCNLITVTWIWSFARNGNQQRFRLSYTFQDILGNSGKLYCTLGNKEGRKRIHLSFKSFLNSVSLSSQCLWVFFHGSDTEKSKVYRQLSLGITGGIQGRKKRYKCF